MQGTFRNLLDYKSTAWILSHGLGCWVFSWTIHLERSSQRDNPAKWYYRKSPSQHFWMGLGRVSSWFQDGSCYACMFESILTLAHGWWYPTVLKSTAFLKSEFVWLSVSGIFHIPKHYTHHSFWLIAKVLPKNHKHVKTREGASRTSSYTFKMQSFALQYIICIVCI